MGVGSLVRLVDMDYEYLTGFNKEWMNDMAGEVIKYSEVTNIHSGRKSVICIVRLLVPFKSLGGGDVSWVSVNGRNLEEISRQPIQCIPVTA